MLPRADLLLVPAAVSEDQAVEHSEAIALAISSGLLPGSDSETLTVAGSAFGNRSTPRSRNEKIPVTTSDITSIVANTGRRTHSSDNISFRLPR